ncbi:hypothetical protein F5Y15DRAFT_413228 [Xylariaceae sp. FL0016]|nr:hypothetical protein F5Y15DRAFT_413228 [Xylariaceae sp. FL0016]
MADPLSIAASVAGLVSLAATVFQAVTKFSSESKGAREKINQLGAHVRNLSGVLQNLSLLDTSLESQGSDTAFKAHHLHECRQTLRKLEKILIKPQADFKDGSRFKAVMRSLAWPLSSEETKSITEDIARHQSTLELALSAGSLSKLLSCLSKQQEIQDQFDSLHKKLERRWSVETRVEMDNKREAIIHFFLKGVNPQKSFQANAKRRQPLTGLWLTESDNDFRQWRDHPGSKLWLSGIPGAGKTILCGAVIEELLQESSTTTAVAFYFCDYKSPSTHDPLNVVGAIAVQLAIQNTTAFELLEEYYQTLNPATRLPKSPRTEDLQRLIRDMTALFGKVYIVVDGLDECGREAPGVVQALQVISGDSRNVSMALFSRNEPEMREELEAEFSHIETAARTEDLDLYVQAEMTRRKRLANLGLRNPELHAEIRHTLVNGAQGMFRWVTCQLDYLCELQTDGARRRALKTLPPDLNSTYYRIIQRAQQAGPDASRIVRNLLHWIPIYPGKTLSIPQLCEAVSITDRDALEPEDVVDETELTRYCSSLVRKSHDGERLELAHFTVLEFLISIDCKSEIADFKFEATTANISVGTTCLRYLTFPQFDQSPTSLALASFSETREARNLKHPLYPIAVEWIFEPYEYDELFDEHWSWVENFALKNCDLKNCDLKNRDLINPGRVHQDLIIGLVLQREFTPLHVVAGLAVPKLCEFLVDNGVDVNAQGRAGSPLQFALVGIKSMLEYVADPYYVEPLEVFYSCPPQTAPDTLTFLLDRGACSQVRFGHRSILAAAIRARNPDLVEPFLKPDILVSSDVIPALDE